jgi:phage terminase small subunit
MNAFEPAPFVIVRQGAAPEAPPSLDETGAMLWREVLASRRLTKRAELAILENACAAYQRVESLRLLISTHGELIETDLGGIKANPCIALELTARALCARLLDRLIPADYKRGAGRPANQRPSY